MSLTYADFPYYLIEPPENPHFHFFQNLPKISSLGLSNQFTVLQEAHPPMANSPEGHYSEFMIIAEFSEIEGPIPLCTIPYDTVDKTDVNLNSLTVHLMSTDYQVNNSGHFSVCDDTQVFRTNVFRDVHAVMQYLTLYDIKARGFVRPFCFGFVTKDHVKIDRNLNKFLTEFDKISKILKKANRQWFAEELQAYLKSLNRVKEKLLFQQNQQSSTEAEGVFQFDNEINESPPGPHHLSPSTSADNFNDPDSITLSQIDHQYGEIDEILQSILEIDDDSISNYWDNNLAFEYLQSNPNSILKSTMDSLNICHPLEKRKIAKFNSPLTGFPLRRKKEPLRPLTTLGQFGSLIMTIKLIKLQTEISPDVIYLEMTAISEEFRRFCDRQQMEKSQNNLESSMSSTVISYTSTTISGSNNCNFTQLSVPHEQMSTSISNISFEGEDSSIIDETETEEAIEDPDLKNSNLFLQQDSKIYSIAQIYTSSEFHQIIEKLGVSSPITSNSDNKSGSYKSLSSVEDDSDAQLAGKKSQSQDQSGNDENEQSSSTTFFSAIGSVESKLSLDSSKIQQNLNLNQDLSDSNITSTTTTTTSTINLDKKPLKTSSSSVESIISLSSYSSDEEFCPAKESTSSKKGHRRIRSSVEITNEVEIIDKIPWWEYISRKIPQSNGSTGLLKFFKRFPKVAHHILFSILLGRPILISGPEKSQKTISKILTALVPLIPSFPEKSWRLIRWHRGILIPTHFQPRDSVKLIGLCIPERHLIHDLLIPQLLNKVTILDVEQKSIQGPAYSGSFLKKFEKFETISLFHDDISLLAYIGSIFEDISSKVYMYKALTQNLQNSDNNKGTFSKIAKKLNLKTSDIEIVRHFSAILTEPEQSIELF